MSGWIKLRRSLLEWEWYDDHNATRLLIHLLVSVNYEDKKWKGNLIKAGSMAYSWDTLSKSVGLTKQQARTAMDKLELSNEITRYSTNKYQVVSLVKWDKMQLEEFESTSNITDKQHTNNIQITGQQHSNNIQITPTKEREEYKEIKNIRNEEVSVPTDLFFLWDTDSFKKSISEWCAFRKEKHRSEYIRSEIEKVLKELYREAKTEEEAISIIDKSIAKGAKNLIFDYGNTRQNTNGNGSGTTGSTPAIMDGARKDFDRD